MQSHYPGRIPLEDNITKGRRTELELNHVMGLWLVAV